METGGIVRIKFEDLKQVMEYMAKNCSSLDISVELEPRYNSLSFKFGNIAENDVIIEIYESDHNRHATIQERKWLKRSK
jgi:hypothetical protein